MSLTLFARGALKKFVSLFEALLSLDKEAIQFPAHVGEQNDPLRHCLALVHPA